MNLTLDMGLHLMREANRLRNISAMNKLKEVVPEIRRTGLFRKRRIGDKATKRGLRIKRSAHLFVQNDMWQSKLLVWGPGTIGIYADTVGYLGEPKKRFKAHRWWWEVCYDSERVRVYRRGNLVGDYEEHHGCDAHEDDERCVVCEPRPCEETAILPSFCNTANTMSVRQWTRCHRARNNMFIEYLFCVKFTSVSTKRADAVWEDVADQVGPVRIKGGRGVATPSLIPCYGGIEYDMEFVAPKTPS